jgi:uncharacterized protein
MYGKPQLVGLLLVELSMAHRLPLTPKGIIPFKPPLWCKGGHAQTILGHLSASSLSVAGKESSILLPDGDQLAVLWAKGVIPETVVLFHGLSGSQDSKYMQRIGAMIQHSGRSVVLCNLRGAGPGWNQAKRSYSSNSSADLSEALLWTREQFPKNRVWAIGFSLSANLLLNLLSGRGGVHLPDFALAVNPPMDLAATAQLLRKGFNQIYDFRFVRDLKRELKKRWSAGVVESYPSFPAWTRLYDFDERFTAPQGGFRSVAEYYEQCSSLPHVSKINTPTYVLHAKDDPFVASEPFLKAQWSESTQLTLLDHGGHLGYLHRNRLPGTQDHRWLDYFVSELLTQNQNSI